MKRLFVILGLIVAATVMAPTAQAGHHRSYDNDCDDGGYYRGRTVYRTYYNEPAYYYRPAPRAYYGRPYYSDSYYGRSYYSRHSRPRVGFSISFGR